MEIPNSIEETIVGEFRHAIWEKFLKGIREYDLIRKGDRIAVCISGGKDSMLMAKCMQRLQRYSKVPFSAEYLVMDPGYHPDNRRRIEENAEKIGIPVHIVETRIFDAVVKIEQNPCYLCARMRRGHLYHFAQELGCNKIALGHHFDDVIETILMGMLYGSQIQTMMPKIHSENYAGMQLIRPMYLVRESEIIRWAEVNDLHFIQCACRFTEQSELRGDGSSDSKRLEIKKLLCQLRAVSPAIDMNIFRSVENVNLKTLISYHIGTEYHHFLDDFDDGVTNHGTKSGERRNP